MNANERMKAWDEQKMVDLFWETIPPVWNRVREHIRLTVSEEFDITFEQFHIMRHVERGVSSVSELAEIKRISRSATSQAVDGLVNKGLLSRRQDNHDRRYVLLTLTDEGSSLLHTIQLANRQWILRRMSRLSPEEFERMQQGLYLLRDAFIEEDARRDTEKKGEA